MIIELEDKLTASIHLSNLQDQINGVLQSDFQRKLFFTICLGHIIHIFDSFHQYCYSLNKQVNRCHFYCSILQIVLICILYLEMHQNTIVIVVFIIKSLINGYMNQVLQMIRFQLVKISVNVGYLITIVFSLIGIACKTFGFSVFRFICVAEIFLLIIFLKRSSRLPPLMEQCLDNEFDIYVKYIEKCAENKSILSYEEYKNSNEQISIIQTFQVKVHRPTMKKLFTKLSKINEQIYKYFICQTLQGLLFYSNLTYIKYFNSNNSNIYIDIMLLSIFGAFSKPFYQFMIRLYTQKQVYQISQSICIISQLLKMSYIYYQSDLVLLIASLLQAVFHYNITTDINSVTWSIIQGLPNDDFRIILSVSTSWGNVYGLQHL
ncbi:unnamed protein product (macronuclear) [Paramecium tetraurelia]|uniref:Transmembrane protein n=1 Tax=Paramecium tetraurelia TaxID=5888 RepID=A0BSZ0_PARTE|nr:uncharacterized protein GSPATT00031889001 [Paramecium tetraurelia]CAK61657.1 unnamed protein product [Paramecium tetraurelia]|eukprot:XP_001429055.1 hypothetical protein (macronuclear) [Paramecium tetraurelia strain d4-2]